ncbi:hypothetical protein [Rhodovulum sulfidophilum]|uniref:PEP-CTERM sorting domain-containing protein n=1 Tax=Rhodovulum sulfidophilum TaxID=35806 RepID=A0ABS1RPD6_RHOSU|nr:hypothetical protein [Rhodovulum sulfidophilum]MBL3607931.1 hypothetical protein [Rhodovulum sulfidophilum]MCE8459386.1 hypothetical protein [Rhodovulum sulfidophilum]
MNAHLGRAMTMMAGLTAAMAWGPAEATTMPPGTPRLVPNPVFQSRASVDDGTTADVAISLGVSVCRHAAAGVTPACALMFPAAIASDDGARAWPRPDLLAALDDDRGPDGGAPFWPASAGGRGAGGGGGALPWAPPSAVSGGSNGRQGDGDGDGGEDPGNRPPVEPNAPLPVPLMPSAAFLLLAVAGFGSFARRRRS